MSVPILESKKDGEREWMNGRVKNYKSFVDNNRKLGQEAFGNEASDREQQRMKGSGWRELQIRVQS